MWIGQKRQVRFIGWELPQGKKVTTKEMEQAKKSRRKMRTQIVMS